MAALTRNIETWNTKTFSFFNSCVAIYMAKDKAFKNVRICIPCANEQLASYVKENKLILQQMILKNFQF